MARETRLLPRRVASGDPESDSVLLWTRRPPVAGNAIGKLTAEVAEDESVTRADPQNLPSALTKPWPGAGFAGFDANNGTRDHSTAYTERGEIYDFVRDHGIAGFATIAGDRHSFWAGLAAKGLPPKPFEPVGIAFVTGSISAPGVIEAFEHVFPKDHPLRPLFVGQAPADTKTQPLMNMLLRHGVRSCLEYVRRRPS